MEWNTAQMMTTIKVSTRRYEQVYGRKPRGYGLWYFQLPDGGTFTHSGLYSDASRAARAHVRRLSALPMIYVQLCA